MAKREPSWRVAEEPALLGRSRCNWIYWIYQTAMGHAKSRRKVRRALDPKFERPLSAAVDVAAIFDSPMSGLTTYQSQPSHIRLRAAFISWPASQSSG